MVLFIPVIPLERKRIIDQCPSCTRHRVAPLDEWNRIRDAALQESVQKASVSPDDPDAGVALHATLFSFGRRAEADEMAALLASKFPDHPRVLFYVAAYYDQTGNRDKANALFLRAHDLAPHEPAHRRAAALTFIEQGEPERARALIRDGVGLGEMLTPEIACALAACYAAQGARAKALDTYHFALEKFPHLAKDRVFRKAVKRLK